MKLKWQKILVVKYSNNTLLGTLFDVFFHETFSMKIFFRQNFHSMTRTRQVSVGFTFSDAGTFPRASQFPKSHTNIGRTILKKIT